MHQAAIVAGALAHDFNNQLTVILGYAEELCSSLAGKNLERAVEIRHSASIASGIASQFLALSRRDAGRLELLQIDQVIREVQPMIAHCLGPHRVLATSLGAPAGFVRFGRNQFKQILLNLALNARDAMPAGGELRISSGAVEIGPAGPPPRHRPGTYVTLRVTDSGAGMNPETLARIFEPFFTTKAPGAGTGLGLFLVRALITRQGGYIHASSEPGRGATFEVLLPRAGVRKLPARAGVC